MQITKQHKIIGGVAAAMLAAYIIYRVASKKVDNSGSPYDITGNGSTTPASANFSAASVAAVLYEAMRYIGTDEAKILNALKPLNAAQFQQVITAFGSRNYNTTTGNTTEYLWNHIGKHPLHVWLKNELSGSEYKLLQQKFGTQILP